MIEIFNFFNTPKVKEESSQINIFAHVYPDSYIHREINFVFNKENIFSVLGASEKAKNFSTPNEARAALKQISQETARGLHSSAIVIFYIKHKITGHNEMGVYIKEKILGKKVFKVEECESKLEKLIRKIRKTK